ncbi:MAG: GNAT family N-acetyltransferase [Actinomycetota bacterium]|nr:GNAT family N-acetyltransferase [Actinomycetota bacterium]
MIRRPAAHELDAVLEIDEASFSWKMSPAERARAAESVEAGVVRVAELGGELVGALGAFSAEMTCPGGGLVRAVAVSNVAVLPTHRRRGVMSALLAHLFAEARGSGHLLCALYASEGGIYGRFGFAPGSFAATYRLERGAARLARTAAGQPAVRLLRPTEAAEVLPAVFDLARRQRAGELERTPGGWAALLEEPTGPAARFVAAAVAAGEVMGYAIYEVVSNAPAGCAQPEAPVAERVARLVELVALDDAAYRALWSYLIGVDLVATLVTGPRPLDEPLRFLLEDPRALEVRRLEDHTWLRLLDVPRALAARRYRGAGSLVLELSDDHCPGNAGRFALVVDASGQASVAPSGEPADLVCDVAALAASYLGATSWWTLARAGAASAATPAALDRADLLFGTAEQPFCTPGF